jgi:hypothetical protein
MNIITYFSIIEGALVNDPPSQMFSARKTSIWNQTIDGLRTYVSAIRKEGGL